MPSPSGIRKDSSIFAFGDGGGMPPPYNGVAHINNHFLQVVHSAKLHWTSSPFGAIMQSGF